VLHEDQRRHDPQCRQGIGRVAIKSICVLHVVPNLVEAVVPACLRHCPGKGPATSSIPIPVRWSTVRHLPP
jgi:hypothetical protein